MICCLRGLVATSTLLLALITSNAALAQKHGGFLKLSDPGSPANMSMLELPTIQGEMPMMGVFNNLIVFDQHRHRLRSRANLRSRSRSAVCGYAVSVKAEPIEKIKNLELFSI